MPDREGLSRESETARVFFAIWPGAAVRDALDGAAARLHRVRGGRRTRADSIHLTLVFLGNVPRARLEALKDCAADIQAPPFEILFDQEDCWRHNRIAHLAASQPPPALPALVAALEDALDAAGFAFDHRPYKAHVTLVRQADCRRGGDTLQPAKAEKANRGGTEMENPAAGPIRWPVRDFVLVESSLQPDGARYVVLRSYPLA